MRVSRAATRYAKAVLDLAVERDVTTAVNEDMKTVLTTVSRNKELRNFLNSPIVSATKKRDALHEIFKNINGLTTGTINLLVDNNRSNILHDVSVQYIYLFEQLNKRVIATVTTAVELTAELEQKILAKAKELAGKEVTLEQKIDPSIVGGFILRVGDQEINASVTSTFSDLKRAFAK